MPDYDDLLAKARALGEAIASSKALQEVRAAEQRIRLNEASNRLRDEHRDLALKIARLEAENKPIEPEDKRKMSELHERLRTDLLFQQLLRAQVEYEDLMNRVNEAVTRELGERLGQQTGG